MQMVRPRCKVVQAELNLRQCSDNLFLLTSSIEESGSKRRSLLFESPEIGYTAS